MRIALPVWQDRVSPVFDVAGQLLLVDVAEGRELGREVEMLIEAESDARIRRLMEMGIETLICAGISQPLETDLANRGIRVVARICGNVEEVLSAFLAGQLGEARFAMPGCCGRRRRWMGGGGQMRGGGQMGGRGRQRGRRRG